MLKLFVLSVYIDKEYNLFRFVRTMYLHLSDIYPTFKLVPLSAVNYTGISIKILETFLKLLF